MKFMARHNLLSWIILGGFLSSEMAFPSAGFCENISARDKSNLPPYSSNQVQRNQTLVEDQIEQKNERLDAIQNQDPKQYRGEFTSVTPIRQPLLEHSGAEGKFTDVVLTPVPGKEKHYLDEPPVDYPGNRTGKYKDETSSGQRFDFDGVRPKEEEPGQRFDFDGVKPKADGRAARIHVESVISEDNSDKKMSGLKRLRSVRDDRGSDGEEHLSEEATNPRELIEQPVSDEASKQESDDLTGNYGHKNVYRSPRPTGNANDSSDLFDALKVRSLESQLTD